MTKKENKINFVIRLEEQKISLDNVLTFLKKLFRNTDADKIVLLPESKTIKVKAYDIFGNMVNKTLCPPNIKEGSILGYYYGEYDLCMLPLREGGFILKKGCKHNKTVRPLFSLYEAKKERESNEQNV